MNKKRIVSLVLSIIMVLQILIPSVQIQAKDGKANVQMSEGQKAGERSEIFAFKNTRKPSTSWFTRGTQSLFGIKPVSTIKTETLKITTTATGLDEGDKPFDWAAFGQNKKFRAWIEVAYVEDKKPGEEVATQRHKVSEDFDISAEGDINATATLDASKTVDYYFLKTEYDIDDAAFKINAVLEYAGSLSPKKTNNLEFSVDIYQIVSTKITYNLIDEYGKAIDLTNVKEEKPADTNLANLGKIGDVTTFNLKNEGTEILWQEQKLDEWKLMSSSLAMSLTKNEIKSNNIDYKLTSTYDVLNGGKVTIQRQKDVVTPKDPQKPGDIPEGYARLNLSADATGAGPKGTFTKDDTRDTQRVVDVRAGKPYTVAKTEIEKQGKPFPLTGENKVDTGKTFDKWTPALDTLGTAVAKDTKNLNATYKSSDKEIIPYLPTDPVPTEDGNGLPIPTDYVTVTFKSEDATKGNVKIGTGKEAKEGEKVLAKVKPNIDLSQKAEIQTVPAKDYGFTKWAPTLGIAADKQTYTAYFVKSGDEIKENDPIPDGWYKVSVSQDPESIVAGTVATKYYTVKPGDKLGQDKFADVSKAANDGYKNPAWYVGSEKLDKPYEKAITTSTDFLARATEVEANKFKNNQLKAVDITAYKGDKIEGKFWNKGVTTQKEDAVLERMLAKATVTDTTNPARDTAKRGTFPGTLKVTFSDSSFLVVDNQRLIVIDTKVDIDYDKDSDKDANAPRHKDEVVKGKIKSDELLEGAKVEILGTNAEGEDEVIGITLAKLDGSFVAGTRELKAGEKIKVRVTLPKADKASPVVEKVVKLNPDRLNQLLPIAKAQKDNFSKKQNAIIKERLKALEDAITEAEKLVKDGKAVGADTAENQTAINTAVTNLENALKALTANIPPTISGPKTHEIFVGEALDLEKLVDVTDGDGADDLVVENGSNVKITAVKVEGQNKTPVTDLATIKDTVGTYKVTYTAKDKSNAEVTHEMTLTVKPRTNSAIEVTKDPKNMSYLITEKDGKAKLDLTGMTLNLVDNLGKKTEVKLNDPKLKLKVNGREVTNNSELTLKDDVQFIEVEYTPEGSQTPLTAKTDGVLRVGPDYDKDGKDDRTQNFDADKIEKLEVIKQPQLDYIAKDKSEAEKVFKLNLEGMIVRMTDKAGKEKLAIVKEGKFYDYDDNKVEITQLTATPAHGATLTPETGSEKSQKGDNGKTVEIKSTNGKTANTEPLKVFYDANKDGNPDHGKDQKTPAPSAMARNIGKDPKVTTVEGMATPDAVIKITDKDGKVLTTEPEKVVAGPDGKYTATVKPILADGTDIKVTAKLGEMGESDPTPTKVFDDKNDNKQPDKDEGFNIAKATDIKFVDQPDLTYLVPTKETEVTFNGKDAKGKPIYLELSYKNGDKTESKIMTLEDLMKDNANIAVTPAKDTKDKIENQTHDLVGKAIDVKLVKADKTATSTSKFAIEIDADGNGKADKDEKTPSPTAKALNVGKEPTFTTITGKTEPGAKVVAMQGNVKVGETTADNNGDYIIEAKKDNAALPKDTKVNVTAQVGMKQTSDPTEAIVKEDKDGNGTADNEQDFDITKAAKIEMVSDPNKMDYLVKTQDGEVKFDATGMLVRVTDKAGKEKLYTAEELAKDTTNFTVAPANGDNLTIAANNGNKVKVTLKTAPADMTTKEVETSRALSVKIDANNNGIPDDQEVFDIAKTTKVEIIHNPEKMDYLVKSNEDIDKVPFETKGLMIRLTDASGKTATYTAEDLEKDGIKDKFTLSPAKDDKLGLTAEGKTNSMDFTVTVTGAEANPQPTVKADRQVIVKLDADGNNKADEDEKTPEPDVTARNIGTVGPNGEKVPATKTTVEIETEPKAKVTIEYTDKEGKPQKIENLTAGEDGKLTQEITPKLKEGTDVKVTVKDGEKQPADKTVKVFEDLDDNKIPDTQAGQTERPAAIASNKGKTPTFTSIEVKTEKGAVITVKANVPKAGSTTGEKELKDVVLENDTATSDKTFIVKATLDGKPLPNGTEILVYAENKPKTISHPQTTTVFNDFNNDGKPDGGKVDLTKIKDIQVIDPNKMAYVEGTDGQLKLEGLKVVVRDTVGGMQIFDYNTTDNKFKDGDTALEGFKVKVGDNEVKQNTTLTSAAHNNKKITVAYGDKSGQTVQALKVTKTLPAPVVDDVKKGDTKVKVKVPTNGETKITVKVGDKEVVAEKDSQDGQWKVGNKPVNTVDGKLQIPVDELKQGDVVKVTTEDPAGNQGHAEKQVPVDEYSKKPTDLKAKNEPATPKKTTITGKATAGAVITIKDKNGNVLTTEPTPITVGQDGTFKATIDKKDPNTLLLVSAKEDGKEPSGDVPVLVEGSSDVVEKKPGDKKPDGFVEVRFVIDDADTTKGTLVGATEFYVNSKVEVALNPPTVKPATGYKLDGWELAGKSTNLAEAKQYTEAMATETDSTDGSKYVKITAKFAEEPDIVEAKPGVEKPAGYVEIIFAVDGSKGEFAENAETKFFVNPKKDVTLTAPGVTVTDKAYTFDGWDNANWNKENNKFKKAKYETDTRITAKFVGSIVESPEVGDVITGNKTITINPKDADTITVTVDKDTEVVVKKDSDGNWKTEPDGEPVEKSGDNIIIKLPEEKLPNGLPEKSLVEITGTKDGVDSKPVVKTAQKVVNFSVIPLSSGQTAIYVRTFPIGVTITVYKRVSDASTGKDKLVEIGSDVSDDLGAAIIDVGRELKSGESFIIKGELKEYISKEDIFGVQ